MIKFVGKKSINVEEVLLQEKGDRRLLSNVPDITKTRTNKDRRGESYIDQISGNVNDFVINKQAGIRYKVNYIVEVTYVVGNTRTTFQCNGIDISMTGILLQIESKHHLDKMKKAKEINLKFEIKPGSMPEGMEMKVNIKADLARTEEVSKDLFLCGMAFEKGLSYYANIKKGRYTLMISSLLLFFYCWVYHANASRKRYIF